MAIIDAVITLPENQNPYYKGMAALLNRFAFNTTGDFFVTKITPVKISGVVPANAVVLVFVNNINQSPVPDIVADADGNWSSTITLSPGNNEIQVQYYTPPLNSVGDSAYTPTVVADSLLTHPTLFSSFPLQGTVNMVLLDGTTLFVGGFNNPPSSTIDTLGAFDLTTGLGTVLTQSTTPSSPYPSYMALDSNYLYVNQSFSPYAYAISRYNKSLTTKLDHTFTTLPTTMYADGTNLFAVRTDISGTSILLSKILPATMALVGTETTIGGGFGENAVLCQSMYDSGTLLTIPTSYNLTAGGGDQFTDSFSPGSPDLGSNSIYVVMLYHHQVTKSTMLDTGTTIYTHSTWNNPDDAAFTQKNSLVYTGGYFYSVIVSNPGKVVKFQLSGAALNAVDVVPLPFSTTGATSVPLMKLGPDGRLYVVGNSGMARFMPGATSMQYLPRGTTTIDVNSTDVVVADDSVPTRAIDASTYIFTDRATTFTVTAPASPPSNVRCHFNNTRGGAAVGWTSTGDGSAYIVEQNINGGAWTEVGREYFGNGFFVPSTSLPSREAGDVLGYRVKAFNTVGVSAASSTATFTVPFVNPPLGDCSSLVVTTIVGNTVNVSFVDGEVDGVNAEHIAMLYRSPDGSTGWTLAATHVVNVPGSHTIVMSDTSLGAFPYYYRVRAEQRNGYGPVFGAERFPGGYSNVAHTPINLTSQSESGMVTANLISGAVSVGRLALNLTSEVDLTTAAARPSFFVSSGNVSWGYRGANAFSSTNLFRVDFSGLSATSAAIPAQQIAYDGANIWAVQAAGTLQKLDPTSLSVISTGGSALESVYWDGTNLWVINNSSVVYQVNRSTMGLTAIGSAGGSYVSFSGESMFSMTTIGGYLYALVAQGSVTFSTAPVIRKINTTTLAYTDYPIPGIALCNNLYGDGSYLYLKKRTSQHLWKIDPAAMSIISAIPTRPVSGSAPFAQLADGSGFFSDFQRTLPASTTYRDMSGIIDTTQYSTDLLYGDTANGFKVMVESTGSVMKFKRYPTSSYNANEAAFSATTYSAIASPAAASSLNHSTSGISVILTWTDNASGLGVFLVERSQNGGTSYVPVSTQWATGYTDTNPPGGGVTLIYRVTCFNAGGSSSAVTTTLTSPNTAVTIQIADVTATGQHIAYTTLGTDTWAAWSTGTQIRGYRITSGFAASLVTLDPSNSGGAVLRMLTDGTNFYTVTAGSPVRVNKYDASGSLLATYSAAGNCKDATIGAGFIWFTLASSVVKLLTSDMTTVTTIPAPTSIPGFGAQPWGTVQTITYHGPANMVFMTGNYVGSSSFTIANFNPTTDVQINAALISTGAPSQSVVSAVAGYTPAISANTLYLITNHYNGSGYPLEIIIVDTGLNYRYDISTVGGPYTFKSVGFDVAMNDVYGVGAGSPGIIRKMDSLLNLITSYSENVAAGQDDVFVRNNGNTFATITDGTSPSGLSILSLIL